MTRARVVVAGLGDTGLLTAIHLSRHADVIGISSQPALVSGQELGLRLSRPEDWAKSYLVPFDRYRKLDGVRRVHGTLTGLDPNAHAVHVTTADGSLSVEEYDVLVISTGVTNGFWRQQRLRSSEEVAEDLSAAHQRLALAASVVVVGGGAAAVSTAYNLASTWPDKQIDLFFPGDRALVSHHPQVWVRLRTRLQDKGVQLHPNHRAVVPDGFELDAITSGPVQWSSGQPATEAAAVAWAIGRVRPNSCWIPQELLDETGFVKVGSDLQLPGHPEIFAVGDVAATDPLRTSARNRADKIVAHNVMASVRGKPLKDYRPPRGRWGSVLGFQPDGLEVFTPKGQAFRFPAWTIDTVLQPWVVRRGIYHGVRRP